MCYPIEVDEKREFSLFFAAVAQSVERRLGKAEVTGSNPVSSL